MSEESNKDKQYIEQLTSENYNSDGDSFISYVAEDLEQCAFVADSFCDQLLPRTTQILLEYNSGKWVPRLREPRDLYGLSSTGDLHLVRWPHQYEVIREKIKHIEWIPSHPEPLYNPTGSEFEPQCLDPGEGAVVYLADEANKDPNFRYSRIGGCFPSKQVLPQSWNDWDNTLIFEARFESGNLQKVVKINDFEYQLTLRTDLYTNKHTQWYYFQVTNTQAGIPYRFTIVNFTKPTSLYNRGMRPLLYSEAEAKIHKVGWQRTGDQIKYYKNNFSSDGHQYFSLTWTFQFPHDRDTCYFAHCYPYTYSNLQDYLSAIARDPRHSKFCKIRILCHSLARNIVYVLTITNPLQDFNREKCKSAVILTARVHPGETNSSWMMKGFLDYLLGDSDNAQLLRDTFIFKVVPMLNPDGVIVGNYRCSLAGKDLNRNYRSDLKDSFPSIWYTRSMIKRIMEERNVLLYCDLHGHSRKENVFMYGCEKKEQDEKACLLQRIFPFIMSKNCPDKFSFQDCNFKIQKGKEGTGRVAMWKMGVSNSYTLEVTFCGSKLGNRNATHFSTNDLESIGYNFCDSLLAFCTEKKSKYNECLKELEELVKQDDPAASVNDIGDRGDSSSDSSDSNEFTDKTETQTKSKKKYLKVKKESFVLESSGKRYSKHLHEPVNESKKPEAPSHRVSKTQEQIIKNAQVLQKLKLMELQNMEREKYEIAKQNVETFSRTTNAKKSKALAGVHELFKETSSILKSKPDQMAFPSKKDAIPNVPSKYTLQYLSHYFPEQGLTSLIQLESHPSSLYLPQPEAENHPERSCVTLQLEEKELQNIALAQEIHLNAPYKKAATWRLEKYQSGKTNSCKEKASPEIKGFPKTQTSNVPGSKDKVKELSPARNAKTNRIGRGNCEEGLKLNRSSINQDLLLSLPLMSEGKYSQPTEKYLRSEQHLKSLGRHRPRLATLLTTKGPNKTILVKHSEDNEPSRSLLQSRPKMPSRNLLCQSASKFFPKRCKSDRPSVQDLPNTTERISFHA